MLKIDQILAGSMDNCAVPVRVIKLFIGI